MRETSIEGCDFQETGQAVEQGGSSACLEDDLVGEDEHARLGKEVGIDMLGFDDRQDLAIDEIQHLLPGVSGDGLQSERTGFSWKVGGGRAEPYF
jgi:hypothetical protein